MTHWTNTETEVLYYWLLRDKRLKDRLDAVHQWKIDRKDVLQMAADDIHQRVMSRVLTWHNNRSKGRIGFTYAIRNMYAVVFYPHPTTVEKKIAWAELVANHTDQNIAAYLDEAGEVSL